VQIHRQRSDYGDYVIATKQEADEQIKNAELFLEHIKKYLENELKKE
jgi:uncharacterized protein (UPF0332 family)